jgi:arsenate reductase-like glutaredoxin family protein
MKVTVYGIRNCDTMKKAFAWLDRHRAAYEFHDYRHEVAPAMLEDWHRSRRTVRHAAWLHEKEFA